MILCDGMWRDEECLIIGGGPSLRAFPWGMLPWAGRRVIAINLAAESVPADVHLGMDLSYWRGAEPGNGTRVWIDDKNGHKPTNVDVILRRRGEDHWSTRWSESLDDGVSTGGNSGFAALHLAYLLGANPIYLLGFDLRGENRRTAHWHDGYERKVSDHVYTRFAESFREAAREIGDECRVVVLNDPNGEPSNLDAFPHAPWSVLW